MKRKNLVNGMILALSVVLIRFIDVRIYDMNLVVTLLILGALIYGAMRIVERFPSLEEPVSKQTSFTVNTLVILFIFLVFFIFKL
ncbi:hypothetical protein QL992_03630 [Microbacterium sp. APC 3898]|uniref:Uncharacterized protein n=1 Tax=Planococcus notacanthi TaxID=3035188 RepID=A0ABT7ZLZ4_9BACL|nr:MULTISPECIES: hypothetical protein [Terrabacteria group]MBF6634232.1 hypothetical protein [Planococcus sp. (in: firmicutes)]MDN3428174.1 hypothetical protein [Planococcus sp. APC 4016]MDN3498289.1 hypothetical protein [Microbacterium sp. APC 3898]